jgi:hypothetical protein
MRCRGVGRQWNGYPEGINVLFCADPGTAEAVALNARDGPMTQPIGSVAYQCRGQDSS